VGLSPANDAGQPPGTPLGSQADTGSSSPASRAADEAIPRFATALYLDLAHVERISRFRSGVGHDYSDSRESCRSMKHYLCPVPCPGSGAPPPSGPVPLWTELEVRSPITGTVLRMDAEQTFGTQLVLQPEGHPDILVKIFHVAPASEIEPGSTIVAGQRLGTHASTQTMSDIAVQHDRSDGYRLLSFFDTLTDDAFAPLAARGIASREALQISLAERDAAPLSCDGQRFMAADTLEEWVPLQ
jgi:hypothetical protein